MKRNLEVPPGDKIADANIYSSYKRKLILRSSSLMVVLLASVFVLQGQNVAKDPGPRTGQPAAGNFIAGLTSSQQSYFTDGSPAFRR
jgi:hypothetical protein